MINVKNDLFMMKKYFKNRYIDNSIKNNTTSTFKSEDRLFPFTNEELNVLFNKDLNDKNTLVVTASGDHILHSILYGSKDITAFDINIVAKYYANLKIAMIKKYNYIQFITNCKDFVYYSDKDRLNMVFLYQILDDISEFLSSEDNLFWNEFLNMYSKSLYVDKIFKTGNTFICCSYYDEKYYYELKDKINDVNISFIDSDISKISTKTNKVFDYIHLSNILDYVSDEKTFSNVFLMLYKMLNKKGVIDASIAGIFDYSSYNNRRLSKVKKII